MAEGNLVGSSINDKLARLQLAGKTKTFGIFLDRGPRGKYSSQGQRSLLTAPWLRVAPGAHCDGRARNAERGWSPAGQLLV